MMLLLRMSSLVLVALGITASLVIAGETDQDVPIRGISSSISVDEFTGTAMASIPIEVPAGRRGMQPQLALTYSSSNGNGWIGMGWKLEMGSIERQVKFNVLYPPTLPDQSPLSSATE